MVAKRRFRMQGTLDGGLSWLVVFGSFMSQFAVLGIHFVFGLLYIDLLKEFGQSKATTGENELPRSGTPELNTRSRRWLGFFSVFSSETPRPRLKIANWFASGLLGFLTLLCLFPNFCFCLYSWSSMKTNGSEYYIHVMHLHYRIAKTGNCFLVRRTSTPNGKILVWK